MGEFTYTKTELANRKVFIATKLTQSDITFSQDDQHIILRLKKSKTDIKHTGIKIIIAATNNSTCSVTALRELFILEPQSRNVPLFTLANGAMFARNPIIEILCQRLESKCILYQAYSGHSLRKRAAQHALDNTIFDEHIQKLGRWLSQTFQLYFQTSTASLYSLNLCFQTGRSPTVNTYPSPSPIFICQPTSSPPTIHLLFHLTYTLFVLTQIYLFGRPSNIHFLAIQESLLSERPFFTKQIGGIRGLEHYLGFLCPLIN